MPFLIALIIVLFVGVGGVAVFLTRRRGRVEGEQYEGGFSMEPQPSEDIYAMAGVDAAMQTSPGDSADPLEMDNLDLDGGISQVIQEVEISSHSQPIQFSAPAHATTNEHGQTLWADEAGVSWCQDPDGSLKRYDAESGTWVPHQ
jgi:hypothetical protein